MWLQVRRRSFREDHMLVPGMWAPAYSVLCLGKWMVFLDSFSTFLVCHEMNILKITALQCKILKSCKVTKSISLSSKNISLYTKHIDVQSHLLRAMQRGSLFWTVVQLLWNMTVNNPDFQSVFTSTDLIFPIDITSVKREHDFLDRDAIEALCRYVGKC